MTDEIHLRKPLQHFVKALEAEIVGPELEVQQHGHIVVVGDFRHQVDVRGIGLDWEFLFADSFRAHVHILLEHAASLRNIRQLVGEEDVLLGILPRNRHHGIVPTGVDR